MPENVPSTFALFGILRNADSLSTDRRLKAIESRVAKTQFDRLGTTADKSSLTARISSVFKSSRESGKPRG
jgi:hypothetical protein